MPLIEPKQIEINGKTFVISKIPPIAAREIITQYLPSAIPKIGDYKVNEQLMLKLMAFVAIPITGGQQLQLTTPVLIDNHVGDWEILMRIEAAMIEYNCSFFQDGRASNFLSSIVQKLPALITKTLTASLAQFFQADKPPSTN